MPRSNKKKKPITTPTTTTASPAEVALKTALHKRLKTKMKMYSVSRQGGSSQDVRQVLNKFNDGDDEKMELMKEVQEDVKGMSAKSAKKYLKKVIGAMDHKQTESFVDMVKDKLPSNQSKDIVNYVQRNKHLQAKEDANKPQVNPETIYVPRRMLTVEQKEEIKNKRRVDKEQAPVVKKKKRSFRPIAINVPKINELRNHEIVETKLEKRQKTNPFQRADEKEKSGKTKNQPTDEKTQQLTYFNRIRHLKEFNSKTMNDDMKQYMLESTEDIELVKVLDVTPLQHSHLLPVPESNTPVFDIPQKYQEFLSVFPDRMAGDMDHPWIYQKKQTDDGSNQYVRSQNAFKSCVDFVAKFQPVMEWIKRLRGSSLPIKWLTDKFRDLGRLEQTEKPGHFSLLCEEFKDPTTSTKVSVPIVRGFTFPLSNNEIKTILFLDLKNKQNVFVFLASSHSV